MCQGARKVIYELPGVNQRNQKDGEKIDNFVSELKRRSLTCEFSDLRDSLIRDRIEGGVLSDELRSELLKKPDLTLQTAHDYCRTLEAAELQNTSLTHPQLRLPNVHFTLLRNSRFKKRQLLVTVSFVVTITHLLSHLATLLLERNATSVRRKDTLHKCAKN